MESKQTQEFFDAGLQSYGKALLAIYEFKGMLEDELQNVMLAQPQGSTLKLAEEPGFTTSRAVLPSTYHSVVGILAQPASDPAGAVANPGRLEVGVWWAPPFRPATVAAIYAGVTGVPWARRIAKPEGFDGALYTGSTMYLTRDLAKQDTFSTVVHDLLGHLDTACKKQQAALLALAASESP